MKFSRLLGGMSVLVLLSASASAGAQEEQLTTEDYARAEQFLSWNTVKLTRNLDVAPNWIEKSDRFWFRNETAEGKEFLLVDPERDVREPAFDHARLAAALSEANSKSYSADKLPFDTFEFAENGRAIQFEAEKFRWSCGLKFYRCQKTDAATSPAEILSPDKHWLAFVKEHNLYVRSLATKEEFQLTKDGKPYDDYAVQPDSNTQAITERITMGAARPIEAIWSPDSKKLITYKLDQTKVRESYLIQSVPPGPIGAERPVLYSYRYPFPGDKNVAMLKYVVFDIQKKSETELEAPAETVNAFTPLDFRWVWWNKEGSEIYFIETDRWSKTLKLNVAQASTGSTRMILEEHGATEIEPNALFGDAPIVKVLGNGAEILWFSERDGWGHLYLYDGKTGKLKKQITGGPWLVRGIEYVDEANRWVYFSASGREKGEDPYLRHLYRTRLDGSGLELLTPENADHSISFSPSGRYFTDLYSRVDLAPVSVVRSAEGKVVREVAKADISALRSKAFHNYAYGKLGDAGGLEDHVAAIKQLAERYPYLDLTRLGIYGHSGGGFATVRAMLMYPDFYKVGVASSGEQDMRGYLAGWGEKYQGPLESGDYVEASNPALALTANLEGKLLIAWGDMDDNVPPSLEIQLIHSLIKANRDFDTLVLPNRNHSLSNDPYFIRRRWDYLVKNLMGKEPPRGYEIKTSSPTYRTLDAPEKERN
ncbi:MAG: DPP IV N-terminal domain-containing protein [Candidatus Acidiferrum sp.]